MVGPTLPRVHEDEAGASAIVAGALIANELGGLGLSRGDLVTVAARLEGHPDNVAPAILGGLVIAAQGGERGGGHAVSGGPGVPVTFVLAHLPPADIVLCIPDYPLPTAKARAVLPAPLPFADAVLAGARANVLVAALLSGDWPAAGEMMTSPGCARWPWPTAPTARPSVGPALRQKFQEAFPSFETRLASEDRQGAVVARG